MTDTDALVRLVSPFEPRKVVEILKREVDSFPSFFRSVLTLNAHYYRGTASVCGVVGEKEFELRNRSGAGFSLRAQGTLKPLEQGTEILVSFSSPIFPDILGVLFGRYDRDRQTILEFLKKQLHVIG